MEIKANNGFIEIPIELLDRDIQDMGISQEGKRGLAIVKVSEIVGVRQDGEGESIIYTSDGQSYWTSIDYSFIKELLITPKNSCLPIRRCR